MINYQYIIVEGNIGAGKTTLATKIAQQYNAKLMLEEFSDNPFLPKFYREPEKYAFTLEMAFMADRYRQLREGLQERDMFKDFTISDYYYMKSLIFAKKTLRKDEYQLYRQFFHIIYSALPQPNLYVYLHMSVDRLLENIKKRDRGYEQGITAEYLLKIQNSYFDFFKQHKGKFPFLIIDCTNIDFVHSQEDYTRLVEHILFEDYLQSMTRLIL